jgi:hypothetical protein
MNLTIYLIINSLSKINKENRCKALNMKIHHLDQAALAISQQPEERTLAKTTNSLITIITILEITNKIMKDLVQITNLLLGMCIVKTVILQVHLTKVSIISMI